MSDKKLHAAEMLIRHTFMKEHPSFFTTDCEINRIDWEMINDGEYTKQEWVLVQVLKFILDDYCEIELPDLLTLNDDDLQAVMLSLSERFKSKDFQENL